MAQQMQADMARVEQELRTCSVEGSAGGGVVKAVVTGKQEIVSLTIDPGVVDPDDVEMLQDLVAGRGRRRARPRLKAGGRGEDGARHRRPAHPRALSSARPALVSQLIEPVARLIEAFSRLPGIGPKTAQRLTYHLLRAPGRGGPGAGRGPRRGPRRGRLLRALLQHQHRVRCAPSAPTRRATTPGSASSRSRSTSWPWSARGAFRGRYHVLHGAISPMDGIGPDRLRIRELLERARRRGRAPASRSRRSSWPPTRPSRARPRRCTSPSASPDRSASVTRIARGIPVGGDLEYADEVTLVRALQGRQQVEAAAGR